MGVLPMASPGFAQGHRSIFHSSENMRNSPGMRKWLSMPHTKYLWAASGSYAPWDSPVFFPYFFFRLWIWCSHSVHPGNTSNTRTRARTGCLTVTVAPPPNNKKTVISSSSKDGMYMDFIHNHCYRSSQDQQNRKKHNAPGRLGLIPVRDGVFTALLKPVEEQLCPAVFYRLVSDIIVNDVS